MGHTSAPVCPCSSCFNGEGRFNGEEEHFPTTSSSKTPAVKRYHVSYHGVRLGLRRRLGIGSTDADAVPLRMDAQPPGWSETQTR